MNKAMEAQATIPTRADVVRAGRKPGPRNVVDIPKKNRITPLVRAACELLIDGQASSITDAAKQLNCSREHLNKMLRRPHVEDYFEREKKRRVLGPVTSARAAHVFASLLDAQSEKVQLEVADRILTAAGTLPNARGAQTTNVNVGVSVGYVIDLTEPTKAIDAA